MHIFIFLDILEVIYQKMKRQIILELSMNLKKTNISDFEIRNKLFEFSKK